MLLHSGHLLMLSKQAYERSLQRSWEAMASIILSAITFECFVNECEARLESEYLHQGLDQLCKLRDMLNLLEEERVSLLTKVDTMRLALVGSRIERGKLPFQDVRFLLELRNALVHRRPERFEWDFENQDREYEPHKFVRHLVQRGIIQKPNPKNPPAWGQYVLVPETARWAHNTVVTVSKDICSWFPAGNFKKIIEVSLREWTEIAA